MQRSALVVMTVLAASAACRDGPVDVQTNPNDPFAYPNVAVTSADVLRVRDLAEDEFLHEVVGGMENKVLAQRLTKAQRRPGRKTPLPCCVCSLVSRLTKSGKTPQTSLPMTKWRWASLRSCTGMSSGGSPHQERRNQRMILQSTARSIRDLIRRLNDRVQLLSRTVAVGALEAHGWVCQCIPALRRRRRLRTE